MSDLSLIPLQDGYESQLSQDWDGNTGTVYVLSTPSYTPTTTNTYIVVNPGKTNMQIAEITSYDSVLKTLTVSSISFEKGLGISSTAQTHTTGSKVIISDNYQFWADIKTAINSKLDKTGGNALIYADTTARDTALGANGVPTTPYTNIYVTATGLFYNYNLSTAQWEAIDTGTTPGNATNVSAGLVRTDVAPAGIPVALIQDNPKYDALAGTSGTPSTSNRYVTADDTSAAAGADKVVRATGTALPALDGTNLTGIAKTANIQTFTSDGTWTKPTNAKSVLVQMWGAGGGGAGGAASSGGGGGGGGAYIEYTFNASDLSSTEAIVVGTGAAASQGGNSSFGGTKLIAYGGAAGLSQASSGSGGGGGGLASAGAPGSGLTGGAGGNIAGGAGVSGGAGGASLLGGGAGGGGANNGQVGGLTAQGGGGGGSGAINGGAPGNGGAGGSSFYGGGGGGGGGGTGGGAGGVSQRGGAGGAGVTGTNNGNAGTIPAGGGGGGCGVASTGGAGARGQVVITTYF